MGDSNWSNVVLLLGFEGSDGSTTFVDEGPSARAITRNGDAQVDTSQFKMGSSSLLLDGTGDYLTVADSADWNFAGEFTVECFFMLAPGAPVSTTFELLKHGGGTTTLSWRLDVTWSASNPGIAFGISTSGLTDAFTAASASAGLFSQGVWYHLAADRDASNKLRIYLDGVMKASVTATGTTFDVTNPLGIGASGSGNRPFNGWIDEVRITKGVARYASDAGFSVPTAAFPRGVGDIEVTANQTVPAFGQGASAATEVAASVSQTIAAFTQSAIVVIDVPREIAVEQTFGVFGQSATIEATKEIAASQSIPAFGQSASLSVECVITVSQTIPAFGQSAVLRRGDVTPGLLFRGVIGNCSINRAGLATLEARSILTLGRGFLSEHFCAACRADLYDARCKVNKNSFSASTTVASVSGQFVFTVTGLPDGRAVDGWYNLGQAVITSGDGEGVPFQIKTWTRSTLTVEAMTPIDELLDAGDTLTLYAGCDKASTTCRDKFSNIVNYRGEEYAAGRDLQLTTTGS